MAGALCVNSVMTAIMSHMKTRTWDEMLAVIGPKLDKDVLKTFKTAFAAEFYEGFKAMSKERIATEGFSFGENPTTRPL